MPGKNLRQVNGLSLVGFKAIAAQKSKYCDNLIISTDSPEIQAEARKFGVGVPFIRPSELATDDASSVSVVMHTIHWIENHTDDHYDSIMLLEPSSPFTRPSDFDKAVELMLAHEANLVVGMRETKIHTTFVGPIDENGQISQIINQINDVEETHRQALPKQYTMNGALYLFKWDFFKERGMIYADREKSFGMVMDSYHSIEIDEMIDLQWAEFLVESGYVDVADWQ